MDAEAAAAPPEQPVVESLVVVHNVAKRHNVGTMARSATAFGVSEIEERKCDICGVEITDGAFAITQHPFRKSTAFLLGNEGTGLSAKECEICDFFVYIPQYGCGTASLNVTVAASIVLHHFAGSCHTMPNQAWPTYPSGKSEVFDLKLQLHLLASSCAPGADNSKRDLFKRVISYMTVGIAVSAAFSEMVMCSATSDIVLKKMCYLFVGNYARCHPELALLTINFLQKDCLNDDSPYVRMVAVLGVLKLYHISATTCFGSEELVRARLKASLSARDMDFNLDLFRLEGYQQKVIDEITRTLNSPLPANVSFVTWNSDASLVFSIFSVFVSVWAGFCERNREGNKFSVADKPLKQVRRNYCAESVEAIVEERKSRKQSAGFDIFEENGTSDSKVGNVLESLFQG
ncbi:hypothetical protein ZIOFF_052429 [Zingiber officinale]|uniref:tRNA/rRNA methyltransferase SpoU type domain-containing protein n=1 Tax=Zingiber officinale TaxID=94328 RepID=A0A8J5FK80_ZINOF|nr:hypothetical protein ZIOFF_052429 [Zingiber officinale]